MNGGSLSAVGFALIAAALSPQGKEKLHQVCGVCHSEIAQDFTTHPHFENGLECDSCHGESLGHRRAEGHSPPDRLATAEEIPELCGACHSGEGRETIQQEFLEGAHGRILASEINARVPHCGTCHGIHRQRSARGIELACRRCHDSLPQACASNGASKSPVSCAGCHEPHRFPAVKR